LSPAAANALDATTRPGRNASDAGMNAGYGRGN